MSVKREFVIERSGKPFVLYAGLLDKAHEDGLRAIRTTLMQIPSDSNDQVAICQAVVEMADGKTFSGLGDASPRNVPRPMVEALIRFAETRAKARALRDAVNVGMVSLEELGIDEDDQPAGAPSPRSTARELAPPAKPNGGWAVIWQRWEKLAGQAAQAGVPAAALTPITPEMGQEAIGNRITELKAILEKVQAATRGLTAEEIDQLPF